jgi:hypothetical protein
MAISKEVSISIREVLLSQTTLAGMQYAHVGSAIYEQAKIVEKLSLPERMNFYTLMIANRDLELPAADTVAYLYEVLEKEILELNKYLINLQASVEFNKFNKEQQSKIISVAKDIKTMAESSYYQELKNTK